MKRNQQKLIIDGEGRRHHFPPTLNLDYAVVDGRVQTRSLEAHIVDHCNLACAECCSYSPHLPSWCAEPVDLERDLRLAARFVAPTVFKLVGGEPLLHPRISEMAKVAADSGIAPRISLTTNGLLLGRMDDDFWRYLDAVTVSLYPKPILPESTIELANERADRFGVELNWKKQEHFVVMNRSPRRSDKSESAEIFKRCWLRERCHLIKAGHFYTCTRPPHLMTLMGDDESYLGDGFSLLDPGRGVDELLDYLTRDQPLEACDHCHGGDSEMRPHRLLPRASLRKIG